MGDVREPGDGGVAASKPRPQGVFCQRSNRSRRTGHQEVRAEDKVEEGTEGALPAELRPADRTAGLEPATTPLAVEVALLFAPARRPGPPSRTGCLLFPKQAGCRLPRPSHECDVFSCGHARSRRGPGPRRLRGSEERLPSRHRGAGSPQLVRGKKDVLHARQDDRAPVAPAPVERVAGHVISSVWWPAVTGPSNRLSPGTPVRQGFSRSRS